MNLGTGDRHAVGGQFFLIPMFDSRASYLAVAVVAVAPQAAVTLQRAHVTAASEQAHVVRAKAFVEDGYRLDPECCSVDSISDDRWRTDDAIYVVAPTPNTAAGAQRTKGSSLHQVCDRFRQGHTTGRG